MNLRYFL